MSSNAEATDLIVAIGIRDLALMWGFAATIFLGLVAGSFLNVVIHRGPTLWGLVGGDRRARGNFAFPRSRCPHCGTTIRADDLIPIISFIRLSGRCRVCGSAISWRYPAVEAVAAVACVAAYLTFGPTLAGGLAAAFLLALIALAAIDLETGYLPEAITLPLIATGLLANAFSIFTAPSEALIGAGVGYGAFALISLGYRALRGRDGLGLGDAALFAAIGAWGGWAVLAPTALLASLLALSTLGALALITRRPLDFARPIPFGPAIAAAGAITFFVFRDPSIAALFSGVSGRV
jgi:leader peptidase (prepilin peptidase)/N-methyltransferase